MNKRKRKENGTTGQIKEEEKELMSERKQAKGRMKMIVKQKIERKIKSKYKR